MEWLGSNDERRDNTTDADARFFTARSQGWKGGVDQDGRPVPDIDRWIEEHR
ncbi:MAG TPA: hypothetical protein VHC18_07940 [Amycolatopsis sp.]|nr:hypothetical protein [Amycolatopsis sp.]